MRLKTEKNHIAAGIGLLILIGFAVTNAVGQVTTQETGPDAINITTDPVTNIKETEATFQATLTGFDNTDYDAALIYWNYSEDSSFNQPGPMTLENVEKQRSVLGPGLKPNTSYNVESYAEPLVWDDPTLVNNFADMLAKSSYVGEFPGGFKPDLSQTYSETSKVSDLNDGTGVEFSPDGTKMFVSDEYGGVDGYDLSTPWDVSTASSAGYTSTGDADGLEFSPDGTKMFVSRGDCCDDTGVVQGYDLSTPWDVSTASATSNYNSIVEDHGYGVEFSPDGGKMFVSSDSGGVIRYDLSTDWDVSTATETSSTNTAYAESLHFSPDGTKMFVSDYDCCSADSSVQGYDLSTPWELNTASATSSKTGIPQDYGYGLAFSPDGSKMFVSEEYGGVIGYER